MVRLPISDCVCVHVYICVCVCVTDDEEEDEPRSVSVLLDGQESTLQFIDQSPDEVSENTSIIAHGK